MSETLTLNEHLAKIRKIKSDARSQASRDNGKLGGRPVVKKAKRKAA